MIKEILERNVGARNCDIALYQEYLREKYKSDYSNLLVNDLLSDIVIGFVQSFDSVSRVRRKLQEQYIHLRGKSWNKRHEIAETYEVELF